MRRDIRVDPSAIGSCRCFDAVTGEEIPAIYADDETGEYGIYKTDDQGRVALFNGELVIEHKVGRIRLTDSRRHS